MEKQLNVPCVRGITAALVLTGLTACGGASTTQQSPVTETPGLITAPALNSGAGNETADSNTVAPTPAEASTPEQASRTPVPDLSAPQPVATDATGSETLAPESPPESPTGPGTVDAGLTDEMLLSGASGVGCDADAAIFNPTMLALINESRMEARLCGSNLRTPVPTIQWNDKLAVAAAIHGNDMASNNFFDHTGSDGLGVGDRATTATYNWRAVGENIAAGQIDQAEVHQGWLDSEGHCINIMNQLFTEVGAACISDSSTDFGTYWVVVFGDSK